MPPSCLPGKARDYLMSYICAQWADRNPEEATAYAKLHGLKPPILREEPSTEAIRSAIAAPEETFANLISPTTGEIDTNLIVLAQKWAAVQPQAAAEWWIAQPDPTGNDESTKGPRSVHLGNLLGYHWARVDAIGASEWLESLPAGPRKTEVCQAMSHYLGTYSPDLAFTVSAKILEGETKLK
jgi:hypothetical protein